MKKLFFTMIACVLANTVAAETIIENVHGYTSTNNGLHQFSTLVIGDDGKVVASGGSELPGKYPDAMRIDGDGRTLLPGLTDAHAHLYGLGQLATTLDLTGVGSKADAVAMIEQYAADNAYAPWILGRGWNQVLWPVKEFPAASDIDAVVSSRPVWLRRIDGHAAWANSAAMKIAGIDKDTPDPVGGKILRDDEGNATGVFIDRAMGLVGQHVPEASKDSIRGAFSAAIEELLSLGVTSMHDAGISIKDAEVYMSMAENDELNMRIYAMLRGTQENLDALGEPRVALGRDRLDIRSVKLVADGALGSRGAAMIEPYSDDSENQGLPFWTQSELNHLVKIANDRGFQANIHAIGDRANQMALDAFEKAQDGEPSPLRNRVEHAQIIALDDIPRFAELGVIASMQATHATSDMNMAEDRVGRERIKGAYAWRKLLESGAVIANGSDFPVELANPFYGLHASIARQDRNNMPDNGWYSGEKLTREETLHSFTLAAAYAAHQEDRLGSLEPGKWADFIIIDRDYFEIPVRDIHSIKVLQTWVGGEKVYEAE